MNNALLIQAYNDLEYSKGDLIHLQSQDMPLSRELDVGEWIVSCNKINKKSSKLHHLYQYYLDHRYAFYKAKPIVGL